MAELGADIVAGNSNLLAGPLGNVFIAWNGWNLGLTTEDTQLLNNEDIKDIMYSQEGTKPADKVTTGSLRIINATFAEISTKLLTLMVAGINSQAVPGVGDDSLSFDRFIFQSHRENRAAALRMYATDENGFPLTDDQDVNNFYEVVPIVTDTIENWGADTQRNLSVQFFIFYHKFGAAQVGGGKPGAFGYMGDPAQELKPAITWPDRAAPSLVTATASDATTLDLVFDQNIALQAGSAITMITVKVNNIFIIATVIGAITTTSIPITFPAATFASGDVITVSISALIFEDTEAVANIYLGVSDNAVINSAP